MLVINEGQVLDSIEGIVSSVLDAYPEIKDRDITARVLISDIKPLGMIYNIESSNKYVIRLAFPSSNYADLDYQQLTQGALAHELGHLANGDLDFPRAWMKERADKRLYSVWPLGAIACSIVKKMEKEADLQAIRRGFGNQLLYLLKVTDDFYMKKYGKTARFPKFYPTLDETKTMVRHHRLGLLTA